MNQAKIRQGAVGELVPTGLEVTSSAFGIADDVATSGFGTEPPGTRIETTADQLAIDLAKRYSRLVSSLDQVGDQLVSDWGKLQTADMEAKGPWMNARAEGPVRDSIVASAKQHAYGALCRSPPSCTGSARAGSGSYGAWFSPLHFRCRPRGARSGELRARPQAGASGRAQPRRSRPGWASNPRSKLMMRVMS